MSWRSHGKNNQELVDKLEENGLITSQEVKYAMLKILYQLDLIIMKSHSRFESNQCSDIVSISISI